MIEYTITFSEPIDDSTVTPTDFDFVESSATSVDTGSTADDNVYTIESDIVDTADMDISYTQGTLADMNGNLLASTTTSNEAGADNVAPAFTASITGTGEITVVFSEEVDQTSAQTSSNYTLDEDGDSATTADQEAPTSATLQADDKTVVLTTTTAPIKNQSTIDALVDDLAGNTSVSDPKTL